MVKIVTVIFVGSLTLALCVWVALLSSGNAEESPVATAKHETTYGSWRSSKLGGGGYLGRVVPVPSKPGRLYTYIDVAGCFRSDDDGRTWQMLHGSLPGRLGNYCVRDLNVHPDNPDSLIIAVGTQWAEPEGIYRSTDGGRSWEPVLRARFYGNEDWRWAGLVLARDPRDPNLIYAASAGDGVWRSTDDGQTWEKLGLEGVYPTDFRVDPHNPQRLWLNAAPFAPFGGKPLLGGFYRSE
ncbi:MAG: hypothetical protein SNJ84_09720, partial [Verrucomicrobiia bacterium]